MNEHALRARMLVWSDTTGDFGDFSSGQGGGQVAIGERLDEESNCGVVARDQFKFVKSGQQVRVNDDTGWVWPSPS